MAVVLMLVLVPQLSEQLLARPLPPPEAADSRDDRPFCACAVSKGGHL